MVTSMANLKGAIGCEFISAPAPKMEGASYGTDPSRTY